MVEITRVGEISLTWGREPHLGRSTGRLYFVYCATQVLHGLHVSSATSGPSTCWSWHARSSERCHRRRHGRSAVVEARTRLRKLDLLVPHDDLLDIAAGLEMPDRRPLDAIHVAAAMACGPELEAVVTYGRRMAEAARSVGLPVAHPGRRSLADRQ